LEAYSAKGIDGWSGTYADNAIQFALHEEKLAEGKAELRATKIYVRMPNMMPQTQWLQLHEKRALKRAAATRRMPLRTATP
jgi:hypothetical protein